MRLRLSRSGALVGAATLYALGALAGVELSAGAEGVNVFWPAAGLGAALSAAASRNFRMWIVVGIGIGTIASGFPFNSVPLIQLLGAAIANAAEGYIAGVILGRALPQAHRIVRLSDIGVLVKATVYGAGAGSIIGGAATAIAFDSSLASSVLDWFTADALGIILIAPGALAVMSAIRDKAPRREWIVGGLFGAVTASVFGLAVWMRTTTDRSFGYLVLLPLIASTIFAGQRVTSMLTAVLSFAVVWTTQLEIGPFAAANSPIASVLTAQIFLVAIQLTLLLVATESSRRRDVLAELEGVFDATLDAVLVVDENQVIRRANPAGEEMFGRALTGINFAEFLVSPLNRETMVADRSVLTRCRRESGDEFWGEISEGEVMGNTRRVRKAIVIRDATSRIEAEERVERLRDEFISHMTHELRSPLTAIVGYVDLLLDVADGSIRPQLEIISSSALELSEIVNDILEFKRSAEAASAMLPVDLAALVQRLAADLKPVADGHNATIHVDSPAQLTVQGDQTQLARVVTNLISNAIKYSPRGGQVMVTVRDSLQIAEVQVSDSGIGIPPEDQPRIFERFFRARNAIEEGIPGTGLGLAYARQVARSHGGNLTLESSPGSGTTMSLTLPSQTETTSGVLLAGRNAG